MKVDWWRLPWLVLLIAAAAVGIFTLPGWSEALAYGRGAIRAGQWWRVWTAHVTHWSWDHLLWDVLALVVAGWWAWTLDRRATAAVLVLSPLAISAGLWVWHPEMQRYRGLSGVDTGLFALLAVAVAWAAWRDRAWGWLAAAALAGAVLGGKLAYEGATGATLFARSEGVFEPVPLAHALGAAVGTVVAISSVIAGRRDRDEGSERHDDANHGDDQAKVEQDAHGDAVGFAAGGLGHGVDPPGKGAATATPRRVSGSMRDVDEVDRRLRRLCDMAEETPADVSSPVTRASGTSRQCRLARMRGLG